MKNFNLSLVAILAMGTFAVAGGDIAPVEEPMVEVVAPVVDNSGFYIGGAYSMASAESDYAWNDFTPSIYDAQLDGVGSGEADYNALMLQVGYQFNKYIALEGRYWRSMGDGEYSYSEKYDYYAGDGWYPDTDSDSGDDAGDELTAWGIYVKPMYPVTEAFTVYGLLGYGNVTLSNDGGDFLDESGFQWGAGASYAFTDNLSFFVDYVELYNDEYEYEYEYVDEGRNGRYEWWDDTKIYTVNMGLTYKF